jgi:hypothetical protein
MTSRVLDASVDTIMMRDSLVQLTRFACMSNPKSAESLHTASSVGVGQEVHARGAVNIARLHHALH